jgi:hypothetical protein
MPISPLDASAVRLSTRPSQAPTFEQVQAEFREAQSARTAGAGSAERTYDLLMKLFETSVVKNNLSETDRRSTDSILYEAKVSGVLVDPFVKLGAKPLFVVSGFAGEEGSQGDQVPQALVAFTCIESGAGVVFDVESGCHGLKHRSDLVALYSGLHEFDLVSTETGSVPARRNPFVALMDVVPEMGVVPPRREAVYDVDGVLGNQIRAHLQSKSVK